ncbi:MAG: MarR family transcriptional regulator [Pseudomonadota bacterium]
MSFDKSRSAGFLANHMARLFANRLAVDIKQLGLAPAQFMALLELWERDGLTQADLMERLDVEQATLANTLARMERDGLIERTPHPDDRRARLIWLTPSARRLEAEAKSRAAGINEAALSTLTSAEKEAFLTSASKIVLALRKADS